MFGFFVLALSSIAATLLPFPGVSPHANGAAHAEPLRMDRLSITKRIIAAHLHRKPSKNALRPRLVSQTFHYRSVRLVVRLLNCGVYCQDGGLDINNLGQVLLDFGTNPSQPPAIVNPDGSFHPISGLLSNGRPYAVAVATALNDVGGIAGFYAGPTSYNKNFSGDLVWQLQNGVYEGLYFDGRENYARALAINDYDISVGDNLNEEAPQGSNPEQPEIFSQFIPRHVLLGLNEPKCDDSLADVSGSATGINDANTIVGNLVTCEGFEAVRFSPYGYAERFLPLTLSRQGSSAAAVNQLGDITGETSSTTSSGPFLYQAASNRTTLVPPRPEWNDNFDEFYGLGLNSSDQVIGDFAQEEEPYYYTGWLYTGGQTYDLNAILPKNSGWLIHTAMAINDAGQIIGTGDYTDPVTGLQYTNTTFVMSP